MRNKAVTDIRYEKLPKNYLTMAHMRVVLYLKKSLKTYSSKTIFSLSSFYLHVADEVKNHIIQVSYITASLNSTKYFYFLANISFCI